MSISVKVTRFPRYRIISVQGIKPVFILQSQPWTRKPWRNCTSGGKLLATSDKETALKWLRWIKDPAGTRTEWDSEPTTPTEPSKKP